MYDLISVDPGIKYFAWAAWDKDRLMDVGWLEFGVDYVGLRRFIQSQAASVIVEGQRPGKSTTKQLLGLARTAGACAACAANNGVVLEGTSWKGSVPKDVMSERILAQLRPEELHVWDGWLQTSKRTKAQKHDVLHAIGIGLYRLSQLKSERGGVGMEVATRYGMRTKKQGSK